MDRSRVCIAAAALVAVAGAAACAPVKTHSGFRSDYNNQEIPNPQVGVDTRDTVLARFGSPSTTAVFDQTTWYYVSATQERFAFYTPRVTERKVLVVRFDENNIVSGIDQYGLDRGRVVAYNTEITPTRGRELGIIEQIFGNIGSGPPIRTDDNEGGRPDR